MDETMPLLHEDLVFIDYEAKNQEELLKKLAQVLIKKGYVKDSYADELWAREKIFPTGLATQCVKVAIPHTDAKYVNTPAILIAKLKEPVAFKEMGNDTQEVEVSLIFMLALKSHDNQMQILSRLMAVFSNGTTLKGLYESKSSIEMIEKLNLRLMA